MELTHQSEQEGSSGLPSPRQLLEALNGVLEQYDRRAKLVQELLAATDLARQREANVDAMLSHLRKCVTGTLLLNVYHRLGFASSEHFVVCATQNQFMCVLCTSA